MNFIQPIQYATGPTKPLDRYLMQSRAEFKVADVDDHE